LSAKGEMAYVKNKTWKGVTPNKIAKKTTANYCPCKDFIDKPNGNMNPENNQPNLTPF
jgi:hypothetical protein